MRARRKRVLEFAIRSAGDGYFEIDFENMEMTVRCVACRKSSATETTAPLELFHSMVHPDDRDLVFSTIDTAREGYIDAWKQELRVRRANGEYRTMQLRAQAIAANAAHGRKLIGTVIGPHRLEED